MKLPYVASPIPKYVFLMLCLGLSLSTPLRVHAAVPSDANSTTPCVSSPAPAAGQWKHIIVLMYENKTYGQIINNTAAPYATKLATGCATAPLYKDANTSVSYNSLPNRVNLTAGVDPGLTALTDDSKFGQRISNDNIYRAARDVFGANSVRSYRQGYTGCGTGGAAYHDSMAYYNGTGDQTSCSVNERDMSSFIADVNAGSLPAFTIIEPDNAHNMHDNTITSGDCYARDNSLTCDNSQRGMLPAIFNSAMYKSGNTAVFWLWDEDTNVPNIEIAPSVVPGTKPPSTSHYGVLLTWAQMLGTRAIGNSGSHGSESILAGFGSPSGSSDTASPAVNLTAPANGQNVSGAAVTVTASASDNVGVTKVEFYVDGILKNTDTTSPYSFNLDTTPLTNASHSLQAKAYDAAANQGVSAAVSVNVSNGCSPVSAPYGQTAMTVNVPSSGTYHLWSRIMAPDSTNNSYTFQTDGICNLTVGDSAIAANAWIWVDYRNGSTATKADITLTAGTHTITMAGREAGVKLDRVLLLPDTCVPTGSGDNCTTTPDTVAPTVTVTAPTAGAGVKSPVTVTATANDSGGSGLAKVNFSIDGIAQASVLAPGPYVWTWTTAATGNHTISATAIDGAGNVSTISSVTVNVQDSTSPTTSIIDPASGSTVAGQQAAVTISASDNVAVAAVDLLIDNILYQTLAGNIDTTYSFIWNTTTVVNGAHSLQAKARDAAGNTTSSTAVNVTVQNDTAAPSQPTSLAASGITSTQASLSWTASTDNVGVASYIVKRNGTIIARPATNAYLDTTLAANTSYSYTVAAIDAAGNQSQDSNTISFVTPPQADTTKPTAPANLQAQTPTPNQANLSWTASTDQGGSGLKDYKVMRNGSTFATGVTTTTFVDGTIQPDSTYTYTVIAVDGAGNSSDPSNQVQVKTTSLPPPDTTSPTASITSPAAGQTVSSLSTVNATATDNVTVARVSLLVDGVERANVLNPAQSTISMSWQTTLVADGLHTLVVRATDAAGNNGDSAPVTVTVKNSTTGTTKTLTFQASADAALKFDSPASNFGSVNFMTGDVSPREKFIAKFNVTGITGQVTSAVLRLYAVNASSTGGDFYNVGSTWSESTVTWNNVPYFFDYPILARIGKVSRNTYVDVPVTVLVQADGTYSIGGRSDSKDEVGYATKEDSTAARRPQLIIKESL